MRLGCVILLATGLGFCSGCKSTDYPSMTCHLWTTDSLRNFNEPADKPNTRFFDSRKPRDILVTYDEISEHGERTRRRAFYLRKNFDKLIAGQKPRFINPRKADGLQPLLLVNDTTNLPIQSTNAVASIRISNDGRQFSVHGIDGSESVEVELPTYETAGGDVVRVVLTPAAVVGDTAVVALVVAYFAGLSCLHVNWCH